MQVANNLSMHGVALNIYATGVVITGTNSIGKSELGLELVTRGHELIADDLVNVKRSNNHLILAANSNSFIHIRGIGFMNLNRFYNQKPTLDHKLDLIIELTNNDLPEDRLCQLKTVIPILDLLITKFSLPIGEKRPLALLIELITKYYIALTNGYDSNQDFIDTQLNSLQRIP